MPKKATSVQQSKKPYDGFPLFWHATGRWAKKIRGRTHYFGKDADAALQKYLDERDDLQAGRTPRARRGELTLQDLVNEFLTTKGDRLSSGELTQRSFRDYFDTAARLCGALGKRRLVSDLAADDFRALRRTLAKTRGPVALGNEIQRIRSIFKYGYEADLIEQPVRYGPDFRKPSKKEIRKAKQASGPRMFEASELRTILEEATNPLRAMTLLAINCGFGNTDVATLPQKALDLDAGWLDYPRPKTAVERRCPLWPETVEAIRDAIENRPDAKGKDDANLVFVTKQGNRWVRVRVSEVEDAKGKVETKRTPVDSVALQFGKLLRELKLKRPKLNFYAVRHTFRTIADEARDKPAIDRIMGHDDGSMGSVYRERIADDRLRAVTDHVHGWLFNEPNDEEE